MRRRELLTLLGTAAASPLAARAQQPAIPVVAFVNGGAPEPSARYAAAFRKALADEGYVEGRNVMIEYHWLDGHYDKLPELMADIVRRNPAVIATPGFGDGTRAAKSATQTIPIIFGVAADPVQAGFVASLARPAGNATGVNFLLAEVGAKRLRLLHDVVPAAVQIAILINPSNISTAESTIRDVQEVAPGLGLELKIVNAATIGEIDSVFAGLARERPDAVFYAPDGFLNSRAVQLAILSARAGIPSSASNADYVAAGGLMSYGTNIADTFALVGTYSGKVLKGAKPAELPVLQSTKFDLAINVATARALGINVRPDVLSIADEVIE
jgi:putative tryptophan/tyrosine transport system substrate-binding protein